MIELKFEPNSVVASPLSSHLMQEYSRVCVALGHPADRAMKWLISGAALASLFCFAASAGSPLVAPLITEPYSKGAEAGSDALRCFNWSVKAEATEGATAYIFAS
jgi:hypothetical protein